jgi:hypothetical protein
MLAPARTAAAHGPQDRTRFVLLWSGLLGFALGAIFYEWQVIVESGQVLAGLVRYPSDNPFFVYHMKLWTVLNQGAALLLRAGLSEIAISVVVSGLLGLVSFLGLSLVVYAFSRDVVLAIGAPFVVFLSGVTNLGVVYPISLLSTEHTYGVVGLAWVVLVAGLFGTGRPKAAGFCSGIAPAIHPSLGVFLGLLLGVTALWNWRATRATFRPGLVWFGLGCGLTLLSFGVHRALMPALPSIDRAEATRYLNAFVGFWDAHRSPVDFARTGILVNAGVTLIAGYWLRRSRTLTVPQAFLLRFVVVTGVVSFFLALLSHLPPSSLPPTLLVFMPSRLLNINVVIGPALLLGLLGRRASGTNAVVTLVAMVLLLCYGRSLLWRFVDPGVSLTVTRLGVVPFAIAAALGIAAVTAFSRWRGVEWVRALAIGVMTAAAGLSFLTGLERARLGRDVLLHDRTNDRLFGLAAREPGMLLTGGDLHLVQLRTRRPVLLDTGGLDALPYTLEAAPATNSILRDVYGIDLFNPPEEARGAGRVPLQANRIVWEAYRLPRWREIAAQYDVTQVMAPADWQLQLPIVAAGQGMVLYSIPR